jgi:hypothetical protein
LIAGQRAVPGSRPHSSENFTPRKLLQPKREFNRHTDETTLENANHENFQQQMKPTIKPIILRGMLFLSLVSAVWAAESPPARISRAALLDKIRGAWAGQMIGVSYGALTEFRSLGKIIDGDFKTAEIDNAIDQDDLYVEMTFAAVMDRVGLEATCEQYGEAFKNSEYMLWHANAGARRNLNRGLKAPLSGHPKYNIHADDIDFQIEADFIGIMCPGLPQAANHYCDRVGRVMNYGDGLYGGMFVAGMYATAYFEQDPRKIVAAGLACMPSESGYAKLIRDVLYWSAQQPGDWRRAWQKIHDKWDKDDPCPEGAMAAFNIDAKLNGAYIALGLLYGEGDWQKTMEIATRCGQDSDCNPSSATGVLGAMIGYEKIPAAARAELATIADNKFAFTEYSFNGIVSSTERRAHQVILKAGGQVGDQEVVVPVQTPQAPALEQCNFGVPVKILPHTDPAWSWKGGWLPAKRKNAGVVATTANCEATVTFTGTGIAIVGTLSESGGTAEAYVDGQKSDPLADAYIGPATVDDDLWHIHGLPPGEHTVRLVTTGQAHPDSKGLRVIIEKAVVYQAK